MAPQPHIEPDHTHKILYFQMLDKEHLLAIKMRIPFGSVSTKTSDMEA